jgi:DNA-binding transcriptional regulator YiaG
MKNLKQSLEGTAQGRKFPIRCVNCGQVEVRPAVIPYDIEKNHDGKLYKLHISHLNSNRCDNCGEIYFGNTADMQINAALRSELELLSPEQIRNGLTALQLNQKEAAEQIGVAAETMSRWLTGTMIQSRAMDNLLRMFFGCDEVRRQLEIIQQNRASCEKKALASSA